MRTAFLVLYPTGVVLRLEAVLPEPGGIDFHAALRVLVESYTGRPMEHVTVFADFEAEPGTGIRPRYLDMFVNEMGYLLDPPLDHNHNATTIYRRNALLHGRSGERAEDMPAIAGVAVLFRDRVWR